MISVTNISKSYGQLRVLRDVSLEIFPGRVTAIVGPSGAGKTTLLQIIGTLEKPDAGIVKYDDIDPFTLSDKRLSAFRATEIGFVFQQHRLLPEFTLLENVMMPALIAGVSRRESADRASELLDYMGLGGRLDHRPTQLSGGESQRGAVARALINSPRVVLADEPTGSLDSAARSDIHNLFFRLSAERGHTFVVVTHDERLAADCHSVIHLIDGSVKQ